MNALYTDLMAILDYAEEQVETTGGEVLAGITPENIRYMKGVVAGAANAEGGR